MTLFSGMFFRLCLVGWIGFLPSIGCYDAPPTSTLQKNIPKGFLAHFESVTFRQINYEQGRWVAGAADALNAHPFKLKFDLERPRGTYWYQEGALSRDFLLTTLRLRGQNYQAWLNRTGVLGLGDNQWLRLKNATLDQKPMDLVSQDEAWVVSPNTWLSAPRGVSANLKRGEVEANGPVRFEAFSLKE